jgi:hypothetical protein
MSASAIAAARRQRLTEAMRDEGVDLLVIYGNAWQGDYLRYATDYGILEGEALAIVRRTGAPQSRPQASKLSSGPRCSPMSKPSSNAPATAASHRRRNVCCHGDSQRVRTS